MKVKNNGLEVIMTSDFYELTSLRVYVRYWVEANPDDVDAKAILEALENPKVN